MNKIVDSFLDYVKDYDLTIKENKLKFVHTHRVAKHCESLALNNAYTKEEIEIAKLCGYLHDIGRFEQFKKYGTFIDKDSCDHGELGYQLLKKDDFINKFITDDYLKEVVLTSVRYHNKLYVPDNLDELSDMMLAIVRDADKIDIFELVIDKQIYIDAKGEDVSDYALNAILNNECINTNYRKTNKDRVLTWISFVYDFNYDDSLKIIKDNKYIERVIEMYKDNNKEANDRLEIIKGHVLSYMDRKVGNSNVRKKI